MAKVHATILAFFVVITSGCWQLPAMPFAVAQPAAAATALSSPQPAACRPMLTGELVLNEVLAAPGDQDLDGDGVVNGRDEAIEARYTGDEPAHLAGAQLWVAGALRGPVLGNDCVAPGDLLVFTGHRAATLTMALGAQQIRVQGALELRDEGAELEVRGALATPLGRVSYGKVAAGVSQMRVIEGDRWSPLQPHELLPTGQRQSIGHCRDGGAPSACWPIPLPNMEFANLPARLRPRHRQPQLDVATRT